MVYLNLRVLRLRTGEACYSVLVTRSQFMIEDLNWRVEQQFMQGVMKLFHSFGNTGHTVSVLRSGGHTHRSIPDNSSPHSECSWFQGCSHASRNVLLVYCVWPGRGVRQSGRKRTYQCVYGGHGLQRHLEDTLVVVDPLHPGQLHVRAQHRVATGRPLH